MQLKEKTDHITYLEEKLFSISEKLDKAGLSAKQHIDAMSVKLNDSQNELYAAAADPAEIEAKFGELCENIAQLQYELANKSAAFDMQVDEVRISFSFSQRLT